MKKSLTLLWIMALLAVCQGQILTSSHLPIIIITTGINPSTGSHYSIPDEPKIVAKMKILYVNDTVMNYLSNQNDSAFLNYNGLVGIELRGSTSQGHSKKPYGFETRMADSITNNNVSLLGLPAENDWVLNPMNDEPSFIRDALSYHLAEKMGQYAPRTRYCEVIVNDDYRGLYFLTEKIKIDDKRVDLVKMDSSSNVFPDVTGGYIIKADKTTGGDVPAWTTPAYDYWENVYYIFHDPKPEEITPEQSAYIHNYFDTIQSLISTHNQSVTSGFPAYLDVPTFVDYMILGELSSNVDIYQKSTFFHKDRNGKLRAGPVWDFNLSYGNDLQSMDRSHYDIWQFSNGDNTGSVFWHQLFEDDMFRCALANRWKKLTAPGAPLSYSQIISVIDSLTDRVDQARQRDCSRWFRFYNYNTHINNMKTWIQNRISWLSDNWGGTGVCIPDHLPPLVISKIHYHPPVWHGYASDQQEFIGITNNGDDTLDVSGVYFLDLGLTYTFPEGSLIPPHQEIFIVSNAQAFEERFNLTAFGEFTRHLSNKSQSLVLADVWGNILDEVTYRDTLPWPTSADGHGDFLVLADLDSDNSLGENWTTASEFVGVPHYGRQNADIQLYPNPTRGLVQLVSDNPMRQVCVFDLQGRHFLMQELSDISTSIDMSAFPSGVYFVRVTGQDRQSTVMKVVKW
ncbi:MAG: CotH kinase family protein [Bacteroidales bacterium]|nr:CotH kinase family protein [Bacteroidales bacterium]